MSFERDAARTRLRAKIAALAAELGRDASSLGDDDIIPATGLLDSAAILALIVWCEEEFRVPLEIEGITVDNFGSVNRILSHVEQLRSH